MARALRAVPQRETRGPKRPIPEDVRARRDPAAVRDQMVRALVCVLVASAVLLVIGLAMVFSATAPSAIRRAHAAGVATSFDTAINQVVYAFLGLIIGVIVAFFPMRWFQKLANVILVLGLGLQMLVFTPLGHAVAGNTNWVRLGPVQIQPSEFLKLATVVWLAARLARLKRIDWSLKYIILPSWLPGDWRGVEKIPPLFGVGAALLVVLFGGDMGTALVFMAIFAGMLWIAGMPKRYFGGFFLVGVFGVAALITANPSRLSRIKDYLTNLTSMPDTIAPSQADFALWAFGSGGISGTGPGTSVEKWPGGLAEAQNDFIFAVIGEEFGFIGCMVVLLMFGVLGYGMMKIAIYHPDRFARFCAGGIGVWMAGQAVANMLVVTGVLPVFGVPLPFISQGGSAVIACLLAVGVTVSCTLAIPSVRNSLRVRSGLVGRARAVVKE